MIRCSVSATFLVAETKPCTVSVLSKTVSQRTNSTHGFAESSGTWTKRTRLKLLVIWWHRRMVYYNTTIEFYGPDTSPTAIYDIIKTCSPRNPDIFTLIDSMGHLTAPYVRWIPVKLFWVGSHMCPLEDWLVTPSHNRHTHCPELSPCVMSHLEMAYIQRGTVRDSHI